MRRVALTVSLILTLLSRADPATCRPNVSFIKAPSSPINVGPSPSSVAIGDFNGDGILDFAIVLGGSNEAGIFLGNGDGTFRQGPNSPRATDGSLTIAVAVGDFNGDGKLDMVATDIPGGLTGLFNSITGSVGGNASVFIGDGAGSLASHKDSGVGADFPSAIAVGDFNGDGKLDLVITNLNSDSVRILLGNGDGSFSQGNQIHVGHHPTSVAVGDFNGDGKLDLAVTNAADNTVSILLGHGDGTFSAPTNVAVALRPIAIASGDFNGDGKPDLAVAGLLSSTVVVLLGDGAGGFPTTKSYAVGRHPSAIVVGDFNNDGKQDLAVANRLSNLVSVLLGNGDGTFAAVRNFPVADQPVAIVAGDFNADGKTDLLTANLAGNSASVLLNNTDLTPPVLTMPNLSSSYPYNSTLTLTFAAADPETGISSMQATLNGVTVSNGQTVLLNQPGTNTFTLTATNGVCLTATQSAQFAVTYNFLGFLPPVANGGSRLFKLGSTIPVKFQLGDANGAFVSTATARLTVQQLSGTVLLGTPIDATPSGNSDTGDLFRYDASSNQYVFNLNTQPFAVGTWQVQVRLDDGTVHGIAIGLK
jgi:hypothetical protein